MSVKWLSNDEALRTLRSEAIYAVDRPKLSAKIGGMIAALLADAEAPTPPVASSPVGGEQPPKRVKWWQNDPDYDDRGMEKDYR